MLLVNLDREVQHLLSLMSLKNAVPNCTLSYTETNLSWSFTNKCDDTDGKMVRYEWFINGELRNVFGSTGYTF